MRFRSIHLLTSSIDAVARFYRDDLGWPVDTRSDTCEVTIGGTIVHFERSDPGVRPNYHFAINISRNKFDAAKSWLATRTPLVPAEDGRDELAFEHWDARAVYFRDPAGNVGELIARSTLANERAGGFGHEDLHEVSEIGLVSRDPAALVAELHDGLGIGSYRGSEFFMGDEHGLFVLPATGYPWLPDRVQPAEVHPVRVRLSEPRGAVVRCTAGPYVIEA